MKKVILLLLIVLHVVVVSAQKETNIWYFGEYAGVDFNSGSPVGIVNGVLTTPEGCATACDANGQLLFYTDGIKVWDRTHTQMPNGFALQGNPSSAESAVAVPKPGDKNRYYLFTIAAQGASAGFRYSEVDMTLNGGLGDVVMATKNTALFTPSVEKITAVKHANGLYVWVIAHGLNNNKYYAYPVDCNGVGAPVTTNVGQVEGVPGWGYLKASPNGKKLATAMSSVGFELLDFDNATGIISNPILLSNPGDAYGVAFSPDNNILYGLQINTGNIFQWNLQAGSSAAIIASNTTIGIARGATIPGTVYKGGAMQLGPDQKLYVTQWHQPYLSVINSPNTVGTGCNLQYDAVDLQGKSAVLGLPGFIQSYFDSAFVIKHINHCLGAQTSFSVNSNTSLLDSVRWDFGDPATATANTSNTLAPMHQFSTTGNFSVKLIRYLACIKDTFYATVTIDSIPVVALGNDIVICADSVVLQSSVSYNNSPSFLWSNGNTRPSTTVLSSGKYWLQVTQNSCIGADTINVDLQNKINIDLGGDRVICDNDAVSLKQTLPAGTRYLWSTGLVGDSILITQSGTYWLYASRNGCEGSDTIQVSVVKAPAIDAGDDTTICEAVPWEIGAFVSEATYLWSTASTTPYISVNKTGNYVLTVTLGPCVVKDTVLITAMPNPPLDLGVDTDICPKQVIVLNAGDPGNTFLWNRGGTASTDTVVTAGTYWVTVTSPYKCVSADTVHFKYFAAPTLVLGNDTVVCPATPLMLLPAFVINQDSLLWSDGSVADQISVIKGGEYYVSAINKCGVANDTVNIQQISCDVWMPNAFTPNGDGKNDILRIVGNIIKMDAFEFSIFNRWGQLVFTTKDKYAGWDGLYKGEPAPIDTYLYMFQYSFEGNSFLEKGDVILIR